MDHHLSDGKSWHLWLSLGLVTYIALIGIFAIEELNGRDEILRVLLAEEARLGVEALRDEESHIKELKALRGLRQSVVALVVSGAVDQAGGALTLREIQCQLVKLRKDNITCPELSETSVMDQIIQGAARFFSKGIVGDCRQWPGSGHTHCYCIDWGCADHSVAEAGSNGESAPNGSSRHGWGYRLVPCG